jgi:hypothetical protein
METSTYYFFKVFTSLKPDCRKIFSGLIVIFLLVGGSANAATFKAVTAGNWNVPATWGLTGAATVGVNFPGASDIVEINGAYAVSIPSSFTAFALKININPAEQTVSSRAALTISGSSVLNVTDSLVIHAPGSGAGTRYLSVNVGSGTLVCNVLRLLAYSNNASVSTRVDVSTGVLTANEVIMNLTTDRVSVNFSGAGLFNIGRSIGGTSGGGLNMVAGSTINLNGTSAQTYPFNTALTGSHNLSINNSAGVTFNAAINPVFTNLSIGNSVTNSFLEPNGFLPVVAGVLLMKNNAKLYVRASQTPVTLKAADDLQAGTTIEYNSAGVQAIPVTAGKNYQNLIVAGSATNNTINAGTGNTSFMVDGTLTINKPVTFNSANSNIKEIVIGKNLDGNVLMNSGTVPIRIIGDWNNTATGTINALVTYEGTGNQIAGGVGYSDVTCTNTGIKSVKTAASVAGLLSVGANTTLNSNGNLTLLSTATKNANVGKLLNGAQVTGNVTVQTYMWGGPGTRGYQSLTSPVHTTADGVIPQTYTPSIYKRNMFVTGPSGQLGEGLPNVFDKGVNDNWTSSTIRFYYEPFKTTNNQYTYPASILEAQPVGKGMYFYFRGNRNATAKPKIFRTVGNTVFADPENVIAELIGVINSGAYTIAVTKTNNAETDDGYNLIGNPYPSIIDWNDLYSNPLNSPVIENKVYTIRKDGSVAVYDGTSGPQINGGSQYILPGQGFFVKAKGNGNVLFQESNKATVSPLNATPAGDRLMAVGTANTRKASPLEYLRLTIKKDSLFADETVIAFKAGSSALKTDEDAPYFYGTNVMLNSLSADQQSLAINYMPAISEVKEIKLFADAAVSGNYSLDLSEFESVKKTDILLYDQIKNDTINLKLVVSYPFSIDKNAAETYGSSRFKLLFVPTKSAELSEPPMVVKQNQMIVFPNPSIGELNMKVANRPDAIIELSVFTMEGKRVSRRMIGILEDLRENLSGFKKGIYIIELKNSADHSLIGRSKFVVGI